MKRRRYQHGARLWLSLFSTLAQLAVLAALGLWILPRAGVYVPWELVAAVCTALLAFDVFTYIMVTRSLDRAPIPGQESLVGQKGKVLSPLLPRGLVKVDGEIWQASSIEGDIESGNITVVAQHGLVLEVKRTQMRNPES